MEFPPFFNCPAKMTVKIPWITRYTALPAKRYGTGNTVPSKSGAMDNAIICLWPIATIPSNKKCPT